MPFRPEMTHEQFSLAYLQRFERNQYGRLDATPFIERIQAENLSEKDRTLLRATGCHRGSGVKNGVLTYLEFNPEFSDPYSRDEVMDILGILARRGNELRVTYRDVDGPHESVRVTIRDADYSDPIKVSRAAPDTPRAES